jgi:hypothetical protein
LDLPISQPMLLCSITMKYNALRGSPAVNVTSARFLDGNPLRYEVITIDQLRDIQNYTHSEIDQAYCRVESDVDPLRSSRRHRVYRAVYRILVANALAVSVSMVRVSAAAIICFLAQPFPIPLSSGRPRVLHLHVVILHILKIYQRFSTILNGPICTNLKRS